MSRVVTEALLEMYFFESLKKHYNEILGDEFVSIHKPSSEIEAWYGYDQGWIKSKISRKKLFENIKRDIHSTNNSQNSFYKAFFLQFKVVDCMLRDSKYKPNHYSLPYYRSEMSCKPNKTTNLSQHNTLIRLNKLENANVSYACGMVFDDINILEDADLNKLRMVSIGNAKEYEYNPIRRDRHFITFQTQIDKYPIFNSEPIIAKSYSFQDWIKGEFETSPKKLSASQVLKLTYGTEDILKDSLINYENPKLINDKLLYITDGKIKKRKVEQEYKRHPLQNYYILKFSNNKKAEVIFDKKRD